MIFIQKLLVQIVNKPRLPREDHYLTFGSLFSALFLHKFPKEIPSRTHCKKCIDFPVPPAGFNLPNSSWTGIIKLLLAKESLVSNIPTADGKPFFTVRIRVWIIMKVVVSHQNSNIFSCSRPNFSVFPRFLFFYRPSECRRSLKSRIFMIFPAKYSNWSRAFLSLNPRPWGWRSAWVWPCLGSFYPACSGSTCSQGSR